MTHPQDTERKILLIKTSLEKQLSPEEEAEFGAWLKSSEENQNIYDRVRNKQGLQRRLKFYQHTDCEADWKEICRQIGRSPKLFSFRWLRYAAVFTGLLVITVLCLKWNKTGEVQPLPVAVNEDSIRPGCRQAYIELVSGEKIALGERENKLFKHVAGGILKENEEGVVVIGNDAEVPDAHETAYNRIVVPRGGEYQLMLADGTKVWLNSDSKLEFPLTFQGTERRVKLYGEAYFQVKKNKDMPFRIDVNQLEVTVLGTSFNIQAYGDYTRTTLVEGLVAVRAQGNTYQIQPGEEANVNQGKVSIQKVDVYERIAWKEGKFVFRDRRLEEVMDILGRWYDLEIIYQNATVKDLHFTGNIPRHVSIEEMLKFLERTRLVSFQVTGRTVVVGT